MGSVSPHVWRGAAIGFALVAVGAAGMARSVVFDLPPEDQARSERRFAAGVREMDVDPRQPWARVPRLLPGPADDRAGGVPHAVRFGLGPRPVRGLVLYLTREAAEPERPSRLAVVVNDKPVATVGVLTGVGPRHRIRIPPSALGDARDVRLAIVADAGPGVVLERARLVEASPTFAWSHLARRGPLPLESAALLVASLASFVAWTRWRPESLAAAAALALVGLAQLPRTPFSASGNPRWQWLVLPGLLLVLRWARLRLARVAGAFRWQPFLINVTVALVALVLSLAAAEVAARVALQSVKTAGDIRVYFHRSEENKNSLGFREREFSVAKPDGVYRIGVMGDSLSWAPGVATEERFSNLIERFLEERRGSGPRYEVLNFGLSGMDTEDEVRLLRDLVLKTDPDFVLLQWYVNDFENGDHADRPRPAPLVRPGILHLKLLRASALYALLEPKWEALQEALGLVESFTAYMYRRFGDPEGPDSVYEIERVKEFIGLCRSRGVPVGLVLFPKVGPDLVGGAYDYDYLHDRVLAACRDEGVTCVDLRSTFAPHKDYRTLWSSPLDPHPSALANRLAAERLVAAFGATWLERRRVASGS